MKPLGARILPKELHDRMQLARYSVNEFIRKTGFPLMNQGKLVLDAGSGRLPEQILRDELLANDIKLETLDLMPGEGVDFAGDITHTEFENDRYDIILCSQVLEHVEDPRQVCKELFRILKPGGYVLITAPQSAYLHNLPYHFFHFTNIGMKMIVEEAGFKIDKIEPQGGHFLNLALNLHYTCRVLESFAVSPLKKIILWPFTILCRIFFGFFGKLFLMWLDKLMPFEGNTTGWNCLCHKPDITVKTV